MISNESIWTSHGITSEKTAKLASELLCNIIYETNVSGLSDDVLQMVFKETLFMVTELPNRTEAYKNMYMSKLKNDLND